MMTPTPKHKFLFIHVMKTGGTSFSEVLNANFTREQRYPDACISANSGFFDRIEGYLHVPKFVADINALKDQLRIVLGHVPYAVRPLLEQDYIALTVLRDPVERTISYLKHCRRYHIEHMEQPLERIYEDPWFHGSFIQDYQTKIFSMSAQEAMAEDRFLPSSVPLPPRRELGDAQSFSSELKALQASTPGRFSLEWIAPSTGVINVDEDRLAIAKQNLAEIEVVGVTERLGGFLQQLVKRYDWVIKSAPHRHAGIDETISSDFRKRIAIDNAFDLELYDYAKSLSH
jgi:hypothetical protein